MARAGGAPPGEGRREGGGLAVVGSVVRGKVGSVNKESGGRGEREETGAEVSMRSSMRCSRSCTSFSSSTRCGINTP